MKHFTNLVIIQEPSERRAKPPERWSLLRLLFPAFGQDGVPGFIKFEILRFFHWHAYRLANDGDMQWKLTTHSSAEMCLGLGMRYPACNKPATCREGTPGYGDSP